jgi:Asp-tRNA(Asn)/Glu-tRNA(Gln) amidotransferase A subunit family amidase
MVGNPAISVPAGFASDLPVGLQLMAAKKQDKQLLTLAHQAEAVML